MITHELPFSEAQQVYNSLRDHQPGMLQVVLYPDEQAEKLASRPDPTADQEDAAKKYK